MSTVSMTKKQEGQKLTLYVKGRIDTGTAPQFDADVKAQLEGITDLVLVFSDVEYISSSGLRALLSLYKVMNAKGGNLTITNPTDIVYEVFEVTGFSDMLNIER